MVTLSGLGLRLRPLTRRDRNEWNRLRWENREWLEPWESQDPRGQGHLPSFNDYVRAQAKESKQGTSFGWLITEDGPMLGHVTLSHITRGAICSATVGYWVSRHRAGEGIAPRTVALVTDFAFEELGLHRVEINIRPENSASLRVVQKLGFREEGIRKSYIFIDGEWRDHRSFALVAEETGSLVKRIAPEYRG